MVPGSFAHQCDFAKSLHKWLFPLDHLCRNRIAEWFSLHTAHSQIYTLSVAASEGLIDDNDDMDHVHDSTSVLEDAFVSADDMIDEVEEEEEKEEESWLIPLYQPGACLVAF